MRSQPVLQDISLLGAPGQTTAIIGSTGAGKSTLVSLIPRLFDATGGRGAGRRCRRTASSTRRCSGAGSAWSRRSPTSSPAPSRSNLRYGNPDATDDELWEALEVAQARDFVEAMPDGLEAPIAQGGTNVSGGQRQRLAIARALVAGPEIYLFDDSFSALDLATDARLRAALRPTTRDAAVIIVAQRVSTITDADQILVLEDGAVVGRGTHDELLETCPTYAGDRRVPAHRGGGGMSDREQHRRPRTAGQFQATERIRGRRRADPVAARGCGGMLGREVDELRAVGQAADRPAAARPDRGDRGRRARRRQRGLAVSVGPKILGHATDIIFAGVIGQQLPPGVTQDQAVARPARSGQRTRSPTCSRDGPRRPRPGRRLHARSARADAGAGALRRRRRCSAWLQGYLLNGVVQRTVYRLRSDVEDKINRLPLSYFDRQPRGELLSRVTNDIDNVSQTLQQTMSQLLTSLLTVVGVVAMMFWISPLLALIALVTIPLSHPRHRADLPSARRGCSSRSGGTPAS